MIAKDKELVLALIYVRVSSKGQDPKSQIIRCKEYCDHNGYEVVEIFQDKFTGGGDFMKRPAMKELLNFVRKSKEKYVVVFDDLKRFARDVEFHIRLRTTFRTYELTPLCLNYNFDESPEGRFMEILFAAQSELEREQNKRQVIQKHEARLVGGYWAFNAPFAYTKHKKVPIHGTLDKPNKKAPVLKQALEQFANDTLPKQIDFVRFLQRKKLLGDKPAKQYLDKVKSILTNVFYAGYIEYEPWGVERTKGHHKPLISLKTYNKIQKKLKQAEKQTRIRKDKNPNFPLRGFINCGYCNKRFTGAVSKGNGGYYAKYYCCNASCPLRKMDRKVPKSVSKEQLEYEFQTLLQAIHIDKDSIDLVVSLLQEGIDKKFDKEKEENVKKEEDIKNIEEEIERLIRLTISPTISFKLRQRYEELIEKLDHQIGDIKESMHENEEMPKGFRTSIDKVIGLLQNPYKIWQSSSIEYKQDVFNFLFEQNLEYVPGKGFRTIQFCLPIRVLGTLMTKGSLKVHLIQKSSNQLLQFINRWHHNIQHVLKESKD